MALADTGVWEVRANGNALNGGYFNPSHASVGTDYTQQNTAQLSLTDIATDGAGTTLTSATGGFTAAMNGNGIWLTGGGATAGPYEFTYVDANTGIIDRSAGASLSGVSGKVGGAQKMVYALCIAVPGPNVVHLKADGTHTLSDHLTWQNPAAGSPIRIRGYNATRGDNPAGNDRPLIACGAYFAQVDGGRYITWENVRFTGSGTLAHISAGAGATSGGALVINCRFTRSSGGSGYAVSAIQAAFLGCLFENNNGGGVNASYGCSVRGCVFDGVTIGVNLYSSGLVSHCVFDGCTTVGVRWDGGFYGPPYIVDNVFYSCAKGIDARASTADAGAYIQGNVFQGNTVGISCDDTGWGLRVRHLLNDNWANGADLANIGAFHGDIAVNPGFRDAPNNDFYPGTNLRAAGYPGSFYDGVNVGYLDMGAVQRQEPNAGGSWAYLCNGG